MNFTQFNITPSPFNFIEKSLLNDAKGIDSLLERGLLLYTYAKITNAKTIIETGTSNGFSSSCFARAIQDNNIEGQVHTIDSYEWGSKYSKKENADKSINLNNASNIVTQHIGNSLKILPNILNNLSSKIDIAHIDSEHDYNTPKKEFELIEPYLNKNSFIFFHDTDIKNVEKAVNDLIKSRKEYYQKIILPLHSEMTIFQKIR